MASRYKPEPNQRKLELLNQLTIHRQDITSKKQVLVQQIVDSKDEIKDKINVPKLITKKVKSSFSSNPKKWFLVSALGGLVISRVALSRFGGIFRKRKKSGPSRGMIYTAASMAARPMIKSFLIRKAKGYVAQRILAQQHALYHDEQHSGYYDVK